MIYLILGLIYFVGLTVCIYIFSKNDHIDYTKSDEDEYWMFGPSIFWPVWVPLFIIFYLPVVICLAAMELGKQHKKGEKK